MRAWVGVAAALAVTAIGAVAVAWLQDVPALSAADAVTAARGALEDAGLEAEVEPNPRRATYQSGSGDPVDVWAVDATVRSEPIHLRLAVRGAQPEFIDDRTADRSSSILSEPEYEAVITSVEDPARARAIRRDIWFTVAAVLVVALAVVHAALAARPKETF
jgi:hypothetical protein